MMDLTLRRIADGLRVLRTYSIVGFRKLVRTDMITIRRIPMYGKTGVDAARNAIALTLPYRTVAEMNAACRRDSVEQVVEAVREMWERTK
jgi:hypothetical protein